MYMRRLCSGDGGRDLVRAREWQKTEKKSNGCPLFFFHNCPLSPLVVWACHVAPTPSNNTAMPPSFFFFFKKI